MFFSFASLFSASLSCFRLAFSRVFLLLGCLCLAFLLLPCFLVFSSLFVSCFSSFLFQHLPVFSLTCLVFPFLRVFCLVCLCLPWFLVFAFGACFNEKAGQQSASPPSSLWLICSDCSHGGKITPSDNGILVYCCYLVVILFTARR